MLAFGEKEGAMVDICFLSLPAFSCFLAGGEGYRKSHQLLLLYSELAFTPIWPSILLLHSAIIHLHKSFEHGHGKSITSPNLLHHNPSIPPLPPRKRRSNFLRRC